jgi:hypothetical protein
MKMGKEKMVIFTPILAVHNLFPGKLTLHPRHAQQPPAKGLDARSINRYINHIPPPCLRIS